MLHPLSEQIIELLCEKTQNNNHQFFRTIIPFYFGLMATSMRGEITGFQQRPIPLNIYAMCLSPSGSGKGNSNAFLEEFILGKFKKVFLNDTLPFYAQMNLEALALDRSAKNKTDYSEELANIQREYELVGTYLFSFDSATTPAIKQQRHKLLLAGAGALNFICDEIGTNLLGQSDVLNTFLELYDLGLIKDKLIKNTAENKRLVPMEGTTPANMLLFGSPSKLLDGGSTEDYLFQMLETGYARRCLFSYAREVEKLDVTVEELIENLLGNQNSALAESINNKLGLLADKTNMNRKVELLPDSLKKLMQYKLDCEKKARKYRETEAIKRIELEHRYFKVLKLAGIYAWLDQANIDTTHIDYAISLVELSGTEFERFATKEQPHVKLANFIANSPNRVSLSDLTLNLPYFKGTKQAKDEMLTLAIAYGYQNNIVIKRDVEDDIVFYTGETLQKTDLSKLILSGSEHYAYNYDPQTVAWDDIDALGSTNDYNWCNHTFADEHRSEQNVIPGFNLLVLDVDTGFPLEAAKKVFEGLTAMFYTTKRHTEAENRYRIVLPLSHVLYLNKEDYRTFVDSIIDSLPFEVDRASNQRSKKWSTHRGEVHKLEGDLFDVLPFIPRTKKNEYRLNKKTSGELDRLESWFAETKTGSRNNQLFAYGCVLVEQGLNLFTITEKVRTLNSKLEFPLSEEELNTTVLASLARRVQ